MLGLLLLFSMLSSGTVCLLVGHFANEPAAKRIGVWLLCLSPLSLLFVWMG